MKREKLTKKEHGLLRKVMTYIENCHYRPYKNRSGGFVQSRITKLEPEKISVELKWGVQDGEENMIFTEHLFFKRPSMKQLVY